MTESGSTRLGVTMHSAATHLQIIRATVGLVLLTCCHLWAASETFAQSATEAVYPLDAVVTSDNKVYVVDRNLAGVWVRQNDQLEILFQASKQFRTPLNAARCLAVEPDGTLLVGDSSTRDIYRLKPGADPEPITGGKIGIPMDLAVAKDGTIYVADLELRKLLRIPAGSNQVEQVADVNPRGVFIDSKDQVWVVSQSAQQVQIVNPDGTTRAIVNDRVFEFPHQIVVNDQGEAFVSDGYKKAVWKIAPGSPPEILFEGEPLDNPVGLALSDEGLIVVDPRAQQLFKLSVQGQIEPWFRVSQ